MANVRLHADCDETLDRPVYKLAVPSPVPALHLDAACDLVPDLGAPKSRRGLRGLPLLSARVLLLSARRERGGEYVYALIEGGEEPTPCELTGEIRPDTLFFLIVPLSLIHISEPTRPY